MIATTASDLKNLRAAGKILAGVLDDLQKLAKDGVSAAELDLAAEHAIRARGAVPAFLGYRPQGSAHPYPATLCVSVDDEVVHSLPHQEKLLHNGQVVSLDLGLSYNGLFVDAARTLIVGYKTGFATSGEQSLRVIEGDPKAQRLVVATHEALLSALATIRPGTHTGDIGAAILRTARKYGLSPVEELGGHGVGRTVHEPPFIDNQGKEGEGDEIKEGMVLAIEPMLTEGNGAIVLDEDEWTYRMKDGKRAAHFEDTVLVTKDGVDILTRM